ncbi:MerR family transcriptional regulator [Mycobacterium persicum]|uniref:Heat shock protein HspR n=1 Tax=Mycobacterium persicum TaxID=1487726 RepID=A0A1X0L3M9_9MYCO|nr:MerR family transcriptional regulator [Mycobacterium persicum]KZS83213.1 MerR family transcriptional regulator [Mycobacterium persicum]ORB52797.1 MerR family transcriptional regulator [Mycobacterium persicum]ORB88197.1 MerR family transcriptional regulator [Mycobacterium persicum]ORB93498.1 MerR family transcriptional regulator [Mycobacterium persicum]ORC00235.1 MerR family transcriptional regulator [Mycobacterium persicum]
MADRPGETGAPAPDQGVYGISVAAELSGIAVQSLRLYERYGLLTPARSDGGTRRYSADDLARLQRISALVDAGINLAGIARILSLEDDNAALAAANDNLQATNRSLRNAAKGTARSTRATRVAAGGEA